MASEFFFLGLYDEGAPELAAALTPHRSRLTPTQLYTLAVLLNRADYSGEALRIGGNYFASRIPKDYCLELLPSELAQTFYPVPYSQILGQQTKKRDIDPRFVLSIMRQESHFRPDVKSFAAARGLMQLIPSTAERMAKAAGNSNFDLDSLYVPETSIQLGVLHLDEIRREFSDNLYALAAAYNGGADNVQRWLERAQITTDPDRFVIEIAFRETKDYVYRVMANYWAYQQIVGEKLKRDS